MTKTLRIVALAATAAGVALAATPVSAQVSASATARINKPLILEKKTDMSFGTILLSGSGAFSSTVSIAQDGTRTCPTTYFTCTGTPSAAVYNASGNRGNVSVTTDSSVTLTNTSNTLGETLSMTLSAPTTVALTNSGNPGTDFGVGGSLTLTNSTPDGVYSGTFNVTVNY